MKVSNYLSGAVRQFSYWFVHGTLGYPILEGIDYLSELAEDSSCMEQAFAIFMNNIKLDNEGNVLNYKYCERRAAEYIRISLRSAPRSGFCLRWFVIRSP